MQSHRYEGTVSYHPFISDPPPRSVIIYQEKALGHCLGPVIMQANQHMVLILNDGQTFDSDLLDAESWPAENAGHRFAMC